MRASRSWTAVGGIAAVGTVVAMLVATGGGQAAGAAVPRAGDAHGVQQRAADREVDNLAPRPPLGWNSWNTFGCDIDEQLIRDTADAMVASGMRDAGYEYVNIDDCWMAPERDDQGRLVPDPERFPNGIDALADYVHGLDLKLGIYSSAGTETCAGFPASLGHEQEDAQSFADWGVDLLKYDNCNNEGIPARERYRAMADAIDATNRPILLSICEWGSNDPWLWASRYGQMWRTTGDITDSWSSVLGILDQQVGLELYSGPNAWNDPDMLEVGNPGLTRRESQAHMSLWALLNAPLIAGNDLRDTPAWATRMLTDPDVLAINQDWGGEQGSLLIDDGDTQVWTKPMSDGRTAAVLLNRGETTEAIDVDTEQLGLPASNRYVVRDVWTDQRYASGGTVRASVPGHGAAMFVVGTSRVKDLPPLMTLGIDAPAYVRAGEDGEVTTTLYNDGTRPVRRARFTVDAPEGWQAVPQGSRQVPVVRPGHHADLTWQLRNDDADTGDVTVDASATWVWRSGLQDARTNASFLHVEPIENGTHQLSGLDWVASDNYWGPVERDQSNGEQDPGDGGPLTIQGTVYPTGLGVHAPSTVTYFPGGACTAMSAVVGIDDEVGDRGAVTFEIWGDGELLESSPTVSGTDPGVEVSADLTGVDLLELRVESGGDTNYDHADWADAQIACG